jgi:hypothetical protein
MMLRWVELQGNKVAKPRDNITISVMKWSIMWGWMIQKHDCVLARGTADTALLAKQAAENTWKVIETGSSGVLVAPTSYDAWYERRLSAERLTMLQRPNLASTK